MPRIHVCVLPLFSRRHRRTRARPRALRPHRWHRRYGAVRYGDVRFEPRTNERARSGKEAETGLKVRRAFARMQAELRLTRKETGANELRFTIIESTETFGIARNKHIKRSA